MCSTAKSLALPHCRPAAAADNPGQRGWPLQQGLSRPCPVAGAAAVCGVVVHAGQYGGNAVDVLADQGQPLFEALCSHISAQAGFS